jgi:Tfp pilus assembly protein PilO
MFRYLTSILLIGFSLAVLLLFANPLYTSIGELKAKQAEYDDALSNSKALENERDKLTAKYSTISTENLLKIQRLLPDNVDNIRLVLEIEKLATPYGIVLRDVRYSPVKKDGAEGSADGPISSGGDRGKMKDKNYGSWDLEFTVNTSYHNFLNFTKDLENNLRIIDIDSLQFSSGGITAKSSAEVYKFDFKIKTYWLKN